MACHLAGPCLYALPAFGPMLGYALRQFDVIMGRTGTVTLTNPIVYEHLLNKYGVSTLPALLRAPDQTHFSPFTSAATPARSLPFPAHARLADRRAATLGLGLALASA
ncbi:MAG: hypothetical protein IPM84_25425 [Anaerolineae bacterium]|nr:hypothetical protein [Anaerolineae bacterium]